MGIFKLSAKVAECGWLSELAKAKTYTLTERGKRRVVYVQFSLDGTQRRLSTGIYGIDEARALIGSALGQGFIGTEKPSIEVDDASLRKLLERVRHRAKQRGIAFSLSISDLRDAAERSSGRCAVSGRAFDLEGPFKASIDRIDSSLGYERGNIRLVCYIANTAMLHFGESALIELAVTLVKSRGLMPTQKGD